MDEFKRIKMSSLLILLLQFTGAAIGQQSLFLSVRAGDEATLPCNVIHDQDECDGTTWFFSDSGSTPAVTLFEDGQIKEEANAKSDRLRVKEKCSLVIKKVTDEDAGFYFCRQYGDKVQTFSLQSSDWWLYIVVALVLVALLITIVAFITWRKMKGKEARKRDSVGQTSNPAVNSPETNPATADPEEGVSYASINYTKNTHKKAEIKNDADEGDAVTYSTVKASTNDPNSLYDTIY
ncbi:hypothetical protein NQZ68_018577 [Dissostichus eleginoides]|nr:hypothetical protein NQZ68_018577 [Dissostichus eleginoides]